MANEEKVIPVIVAIRARPLSAKEIDEGSSTCLDFFVENGQVNINGKPFYFDHVFDSTSKQEAVYDMCAEPLIDKLFEGYNCTIFAYGQTGSGKTFTMGTESCDLTANSDRKGMIPRIVEAIFAKVDVDDESEIIVKCSMLEIYEERVLDLLSDKSEKPELFIREHPQEGIFVQNLSQVQVDGFHQTMQQLATGCISRTKGGTAMNSESSRSHAIFTIFVKKSLKADSGTTSCYSKLHLVDLAGSERLKKTQAQGERKKEGIKINEGLLALGNVISALTDPTQQRSHIPYRDSKLTRLLQDSLGGNTYTVMITCVSPADSNYDETLNSLRYAERAKKIKNKPKVNEDKTAREICNLRKKLDEMQKQLLEYQLMNQLGSQAPCFDSSALAKYKQENDSLKSEKAALSDRLTQMVLENGTLIEKMAQTACQRDKFKEKLIDLQQNLDLNVTQFENQITSNNLNDSSVHITQNENLKVYIERCKDIQKKLQDLQNDEVLLPDTSFDKENEENDEEFDEEKFISRHSAASKQLEHLLKQITDKEKLIKDSAMNMEQFEQLKADHQKEIDDLKEKIDAVMREKKELESQLVTVSKTSKISENRRKKMTELEKQLTDYKKKLQELQKFEKMKQQNDQAISKMKEEVAALKQQRVQLTRQLRLDKQRFTEWQTKAEKQMNQMKVKEKRREYEVVLAKRNFDQQLNVHRRKYEEAVALSKRLQVQLQRQNTVKKDQFSEGQETDKLRNEIKDFLEKEIELLASTEEAKLYCDNLLKQRSNLNQQLRKYERQFNRLIKNPMKKADDENAQSDYVTAEHLQEKIESLRKEVLLRTNEIQELREKISSLDAAQMEEKRWSSLRTPVQVKCAMKILFSMAVSFRTDYLQTDHQLSDLHTNFDLLNEVVREKENKINDLQRQNAESERTNEDRFSSLQIEYNSKIASYLSIFTKLSSGQPLDDEMRKLIQLCGEDAEKLQMLTEKLDEKDLENQKLTKELSKAKVRGIAQGKFFQHMSSTKKRKSSDRKRTENKLLDVNDNDEHVIRSRFSRVIKQPARFGRLVDPRNLTIDMGGNTADENNYEATSSTENRSPGAYENKMAYIDDDDDEDDGDDAADVDYRDTPMYKRKTQMFTFNKPPIEFKAENLDEEEAPSRKKSRSNVESCRCYKGRCGSHLCGCVKRNGLCGESCKCSSSRCENRLTEKASVKCEDGNAVVSSIEKAIDVKVFAPTENLNTTFVSASTSSMNVDTATTAADFLKTSTPNAAALTSRLEIPNFSTPAVNRTDESAIFAKPANPTPQILMRGLMAPSGHQKFSPSRNVPFFKSLASQTKK